MKRIYLSLIIILLIISFIGAETTGIGSGAGTNTTKIINDSKAFNGTGAGAVDKSFSINKTNINPGINVAVSTASTASVKNDKLNYVTNYLTSDMALYRKGKPDVIIKNIIITSKDSKTKITSNDPFVSINPTFDYYYVITSTENLNVVEKNIIVENGSEFDITGGMFPPNPGEPKSSENYYKYNYPIIYNRLSNGWNDIFSIYDFKDICSKYYSNCTWIVKDKTTTIYFTSNRTIDPTIYSVSGCGNLNQTGGYYKLTQNITELFGNNCINIVASDVTFDCDGYSIIGVDEGLNTHAGVFSNQLNTTIINCKINMNKQWSDNRSMAAMGMNPGMPNGYGIILVGTSNAYIYNNILNSQDFGIELQGAINSTIISNTMKHNYVALKCWYESSDNEFINNDAVPEENPAYKYLLDNNISYHGVWDMVMIDDMVPLYDGYCYSGQEVMINGITYGCYQHENTFTATPPPSGGGTGLTPSEKAMDIQIRNSYNITLLCSIVSEFFNKTGKNYTDEQYQDLKNRVVNISGFGVSDETLKFFISKFNYYCLNETILNPESVEEIPPEEIKNNNSLIFWIFLILIFVLIFIACAIYNKKLNKFIKDYLKINQ